MTKASNIDPALKAKLTRLRLRLDLADEDTLVLKSVPANHRSFNKTRTNLLIKRSAVGMPCVVCVDEDLEYTGEDQVLASAFAASSTQRGWRMLTLGGCLHSDLTAALDYALAILEANEELGQGSEMASAPRTGLLATWAENLTDPAASCRLSMTLCRDEEVEQAAACVLGWQGRLLLIIGEAGVGKTNLLCGTAGLLARRKREVLSVNMGAIMAGRLFESEREALLTSLLREARESGAVLALEQAEWASIGVPRGLVLLREAMDRGVRLIATTTPEHQQRFASHPLESRLETVQLSELCPDDACRVLEALRPSIAVHHGVQIDVEVEQAAVGRTLSMGGRLPGKAVGLLDAAAALAGITGHTSVSLTDVYIAASRLLN
jgi:ATP-dependent Clp protease ATP-binding subunit ClpA